MTDLLEKCTVCRALVDEEDLFCANCGAEAPRSAPAEATATAITTTHNFECDGCGASMSYDASARTLRCPFCGSETLTAQRVAKTMGPRRVAPFVIDRTGAESRMRAWLKKGFWRPGNLAGAAAITQMAAVYVPYWVFRARTFTYWTADSNVTPPGARGDWVPHSGEHRGVYEGVLIGASSALTPAETWAIRPFDLAVATAPESVDLENAIVEQFRVQRKYARPLARQGLVEMERAACTKYIPGRSRNVKVNVRMEGLESEPILLPVWIMAYRYRGQLYRFLLNGQSGQATGQAPFSWAKLAKIIAAVVGLALLLLVIQGVVAAFSN